MYSAKLAKQKSTTTKMSVAIAGLAVSLTAIIACAGAFVGINFDSTKTLLTGGKVYYEKDINYLKDSAKSGADTAYKDGYTEGKDSQAGAITDAHNNGYTEGVNSQTGAINDAHNNGYTEGVNSQTGAITDAHNNGYTEGVNSQKDKINSAFADGNAAGIAQAKLINVGDYIDGFFFNVKEKFDFSTLDWSNPTIKTTDRSGKRDLSVIILVADFIPSTDIHELESQLGRSNMQLQVWKLEDPLTTKTAYFLMPHGSAWFSYAGNRELIESTLGFESGSSDENIYAINPGIGTGAKFMWPSGNIATYVYPQQEIWGKLISSKDSFRAKYTPTQLKVGDKELYANTGITWNEYKDMQMSKDEPIQIMFNDGNHYEALTIQNIAGYTGTSTKKGIFISTSHRKTDQFILFSSQQFSHYTVTAQSGWNTSGTYMNKNELDKISLDNIKSEFIGKSIISISYENGGEVSNADMAIINKLLSSTPFPTFKA